MTEADVATKAPESDAQESPIPGDTPAQTGPTMGEHCTTDRPTPAGEAPKGEVRKLGGVDVYIAKPESYPTNPSKLLLLLTGGTGLKSTNNQIQADKFADEGYVVVMPDMFEGDPAPNSTTVPDAETEGTSFLETVKLKAAETAKSFMIDMWLARHTEEKVMPLLEKVFHACEGEFADAVGNGGGIYAVGYCFGGRYILLLASERTPASTGWSGAQKPADEEAGEGQGPTKKGPYIKAGALAHATLVSPDDFEHLQVPVSLACVEHDPMFPDDVREAGEDTMSKTNVEHEVQVYPGVPHGFAVYGDYEDANIKDAQATAHEQMLKWIKEH
ncbi:Uu.00g102540.m01.CDS01 [Anthostomella pinea]|uniref:Uu.00g102540.m01.CDS01 n=1 Tax=Anthostomella pinea TaxID=933095 RepID=A0AAI8YD41_9PEZI|nr:Uu.00g102540.m01.CDS01 [Anthostomella pinea]